MQRLIELGVKRPIEPRDVLILRVCVDRLGEAKQNLSSPLGVLQVNQLERSTKLYESAIQCWTGDESKGLATMKGEIESNPKIAWWTYRSARVYQTMSSQREQALTHFRQIAKGFPAGSEPWLDARARTVQTLRLAGETVKAKELAEVVFASYPSAMQEWQSRFDR